MKLWSIRWMVNFLRISLTSIQAIAPSSSQDLWCEDNSSERYFWRIERLYFWGKSRKSIGSLKNFQVTMKNFLPLKAKMKTKYLNKLNRFSFNLCLIKHQRRININWRVSWQDRWFKSTSYPWWKVLGIHITTLTFLKILLNFSNIRNTTNHC